MVRPWLPVPPGRSLREPLPLAARLQMGSCWKTASPPLSSATTYTATITNGVKDTNGSSLASSSSWSFTTGAASACCAPPNGIVLENCQSAAFLRDHLYGDDHERRERHQWFVLGFQFLLVVHYGSRFRLLRASKWDRVGKLPVRRFPPRPPIRRRSRTA